MIKVLVVKANTPEERAKKIEEVENLNNSLICKGTQLFEYKNTLYAYVYCNEDLTKVIYPEENQLEGEKKPERKELHIKKETLEKWKSEKPTEKQIEAIKKLGIQDNIIETLSKYDAFLIIKENRQ